MEDKPGLAEDGGEFADWELAAAIADFNAQPKPDVQPSAVILRSAASQRAALRPPGPDLPFVDDLQAPEGLSVRLYRPGAAPPGVVVYLHGGGWTIGGLDTHDRACRRLAASSGLAVLAVDYRLAPEHPWPAAVDDTVAVLRWVAQRPESLGTATRRIAVAGDSAGGTLAALACLRLRREDPAAMPAVQALLYSNTDLAATGGSLDEKATGFGLDTSGIHWFNDQWVPDRDRWFDPSVSPLRERDLTGLPTALVVTCEHDPLRDQGDAYAQRLQDAGVMVRHRCEPGMVHNFMLWDLLSPACAAAADRVASDLAELLAATPDRP